MELFAFKRVNTEFPSFIEMKIADIDKKEPPVIDSSIYDSNELAQQLNDALLSAKMAVQHYNVLYDRYRQICEFDERRIGDICQSYNFIAKEHHIKFDDVKSFLDKQGDIK